MASIYEVKEWVYKMARYSISRLHLYLRHCLGGGDDDGDGIFQQLKFSATCNPELTLPSSKALTSPYPSSSKYKVQASEGPSCGSEK